MVEKTLKKGDAVRLVEALEAQEMSSADNVKYWVAVRPWHMAPENESKAPHKLFDVFLGIYMGTKYIPVFDRRASRGRIDKLLHSFMFNNSEIFIDPKYIEVAAKLDDVKEDT